MWDLKNLSLQTSSLSKPKRTALRSELSTSAPLGLQPEGRPAHCGFYHRVSHGLIVNLLLDTDETETDTGTDIGASY